MPINRLLILLISICTLKSFSQANVWVWMKGDSMNAMPGSYGAKGIPNITNKPKGTYEAAEWVDKYGNFWLFTGGSGFYNSLWKYNPTTNEWTWMNGASTGVQSGTYGTKGVSSALNTPGGRLAGTATWTDTAGYLWLFGGLGLDAVSPSASYLNDLWRYDPNPSSPTYNQWTWMHGSNLIDQKGIYGIRGIASPNNTPGARFETSCTWVDNNNNLWLFGGVGKDSVGGLPIGYLNDLWMYNTTTNEWTWMNGDPLLNQNGDYFTLGTANAASKPGGRMCYTSWKDVNGNLWLYGGNGLDDVSPTGNFLDDMWMYDPNPLSTTFNQWTWISGSSTIASQQAPTFGTKCIASALNYPGTRFETRSRWTDDCGNFWMIGGGFSAFSNDLWKYTVSSGEWTWMSGDNTAAAQGHYGTQGIASPLNKPGSINGANAWKNDRGLWLYGGTGTLIEGNDLWLYILDTLSANFTADTTTGCSPLTVNFTNTSTGNCSEIKSYLWDFGDPASGTQNTSTNINASHVFNNPNTSYTVSLIAISCTGQKDTATKIISTNSAITLSITPSSSLSVCQGDSVTLNAAGAQTFTWFPSTGLSSSTGATTIAFPTIHTTYTLTGYDSSGCNNTSIISISVTPYPTANAGNDTAICTGQTAMLIANGGISYLWNTGASAANILVSPTAYSTYTVTVFNGSCSKSDEVNVTVYPLPTASAGNNVSIYKGNSTTLSASGNGTYLWLPSTSLSCNTCSNPVASPQETTTYILTVTDTNGCIKTDTLIITVEVNDCDYIFVPNVFSPNNDGQNDFECILSNCILEATFTIYNRWGEVVFETTDYTQCWDGIYKTSTAATGVYDYVINGILLNKQPFLKKGNLSIIR